MACGHGVAGARCVRKIACVTHGTARTLSKSYSTALYDLYGYGKVQYSCSLDVVPMDVSSLIFSMYGGTREFTKLLVPPSLELARLSVYARSRRSASGYTATGPTCTVPVTEVLVKGTINYGV